MFIFLPRGVNTPIDLGQMRNTARLIIADLWPRWDDPPAAKKQIEQYLKAISQSNTAAALQVCSRVDSETLARQIAQWGGADIRDLQFGSLVQTRPSYGRAQSQWVGFFYRPPGQTDWKRASLEMFWLHGEKSFGTIPTPQTCYGTSDWVQ